MVRKQFYVIPSKSNVKLLYRLIFEAHLEKIYIAMPLTHFMNAKDQRGIDEFIKKLGPEPLNELSKKVFREITLSTSRPIKLLLMDQKKISGVGNIYANDALWLAGIDPRRKSSTLSKKKIDKLFSAIETVLKEGIRKGGASEQTFVTPDGSTGQYQKHTLVYAREGQLCNRCGKKIKKLKLSGRGTYYCGYCQK